ncbi:hypothetical protein IKG45_00515 [Candidatus Saccharibacteria bacterium]|nr:hypothetical protein [Candidatus Saccharibacteria bacterium]
MDFSVVIFAIAVVIVGALVFIAILLTNKKAYSFNKEDYQSDFLLIENKLAKDNPMSYNVVVVEADKLLDKALCEMGVQGKTMGDRLKRSSERFSQLNSVWYAHKLRNQIAHEHGFKLEYNQSRHALETYKQALKDLGAI